MTNTAFKNELIALLESGLWFGEWAEKHIAAREKLKMELTCYEVVAINKDDFADRFTEEEIESLTDTDMEAIAEKMSDAYYDNGFWTDLDNCAAQILKNKSINQ